MLSIFRAVGITTDAREADMTTQVNYETYTYRINVDNTIASVSENWHSFAVENGGTESCKPENVIGSPLWDFISGQETRHLYEIILKKARTHKQPVQLKFRCDSPDNCRYLQLSIIPLKDDTLEFQSKILRTISREPIVLLENNRECSDSFVKMCSVCKKIAVSDSEWEETDLAINSLQLFDYKQLPQISHGLCQSCFNEAIAEATKNIL
jgi:hypothetical protein